MPRLPIPGSDEGVWGDILNEYLSVEHNADGSLKKTPQINQKVDRTGDTMAGPLSLSGSPTDSLHAATKGYVDGIHSTHASDTTDVHGIADTAQLETQAGAQTKVDTHSATTTSIHGIADTAQLETHTGAQNKIDTHEAATDPHGDRAYADSVATQAETNANSYTDSAVASGSSQTLTTTGDILTHDGTDPIRLGIGTTNQVLTVAGGQPVWADVPVVPHIEAKEVGGGSHGSTQSVTWTTAFTATPIVVVSGLRNSNVLMDVYVKSKSTTGATFQQTSNAPDSYQAIATEPS